VDGQHFAADASALHDKVAAIVPLVDDGGTLVDTIHVATSLRWGCVLCPW
jgi:hypothetical protein